MNFEEARAEYTRLRQGYDNRQLSAEEYGQRVQGLQVRDANGGYWAIDGNSGGWLRYDGSAWVQGQPPLPQSSPPSGPYGAPSALPSAPQGNFEQPAQGGFGQQQQGNYGVPAAGTYGNAVPLGAPPQAPAKRGNRGLLIGCGVVSVLLLLCVGIGAVALARFGAFAPSGVFAVFVGENGLTETATAKTLNGSRPGEQASEFPNKTPMYVTYTARNVKKNEAVDLKLFRNNVPVVLAGDTRTYFDKDATFYGYYSYIPDQVGTYRAELFYQGEATPSKTIEFTVR